MALLGLPRFSPWTGQPDLIVFNEDYLAEPALILGADSHEAQHVGQESIYAEFSALTPDELRAIRAGEQPDPMAAYGYTIDEVADWNRFEDAFTFSEFWIRPAEVDARLAGREAGSLHSFDDFLVHVDAALNPADGQRDTITLPDPHQLDIEVPPLQYPIY